MKLQSGQAINELMSVLNSGKVNLKKAINRTPVAKKEPAADPPVLFARVLRRQVTEPGTSSDQPIRDQLPALRSINVQVG